MSLHAGQIVRPGTLLSVLDQAEMTVEDLIELLEMRNTEAVLRRYTVVLIPDPNDGAYTVTVPALPGLVSHGETLEEALAMAQEAITFHLECLA